MPKLQDIQELPKPRPSGGGGMKITLLAMLAVALLSGAAFWLTRDDAQKQELKSRMLDALNDSPVGVVSKYFTPPPPPPPPRVTTPATQPGTLAGQVVQGEVPDVSAGEDGETPPAVAPKVEEDSVVSLGFVDGLAQWMVSRYQPGKGVGWSLSGLNVQYGVKMHGLKYSGTDPYAGRASLLRYIFNAPMLAALYNLYADRFVAALGTAAQEPRQGKALTPEQTDALYKACAGQFSALAGVLQGVGSLTDFTARMENIARLSQQATGIHSQTAEAVFALDEAREANSKGRMEAAQLRVTGLNAQYQRVMGERKAAQQQLVQAIRRAAPAAGGVDEDTTLYVAAWLERRRAENPHSVQTALTASRLLDDLASRLRKAGSIAR